MEEKHQLKSLSGSKLRAQRLAPWYAEQSKVILQEYNQVLSKRGHASYEALCRHHHVPMAFFRHWLQEKGQTVADLVYETKEDLSTRYYPNKEVIEAHDYEGIIAYYKKWLVQNPRLPLRTFCNNQGFEYTHVHQWLKRQHISIEEIKISAGVKLSSSKNSLQPSNSQLFGRVLHRYKQVLVEHPNYSLRQHCKDCGADYGAMQQWLARVGIQIKQLKQAVLIEQQVPKCPRPVFVQFKPNGGTNGDRLTGVKIQLADGSNIQVEECTVISLCAFINQYNEDQKRK